MKHFRILEILDNNKYYTIQYQKSLFFGLHYWKNFDNTKYIKYDDSLNVIKNIINKNDYEKSNVVYHYIDAYKIFKHKDKNSIK